MCPPFGCRWNATFDPNGVDPMSYINQTTGLGPMSGILPDGSPRPIDLARVTLAQLTYLNETVAALELGYKSELWCLLFRAQAHNQGIGGHIRVHALITAAFTRDWFHTHTPRTHACAPPAMLDCAVRVCLPSCPRAGCFDALNDAITALVALNVAAQSGGGGGSTCVRVVIQLSQSLVLTRQVGGYWVDG